MCAVQSSQADQYLKHNNILPWSSSSSSSRSQLAWLSGFSCCCQLWLNQRLVRTCAGCALWAQQCQATSSTTTTTTDHFGGSKRELDWDTDSSIWFTELQSLIFIDKLSLLTGGNSNTFYDWLCQSTADCKSSQFLPDEVLRMIIRPSCSAQRWSRCSSSRWRCSWCPWQRPQSAPPAPTVPPPPPTAVSGVTASGVLAMDSPDQRTERTAGLTRTAGVPGSAGPGTAGLV